MEKEITKKYANGKLIVVWKPKKCIHAKVCVHMLPEVFKPRDKPCITLDATTTSALKN